MLKNELSGLGRRRSGGLDFVMGLVSFFLLAIAVLFGVMLRDGRGYSTAGFLILLVYFFYRRMAWALYVVMLGMILYMGADIYRLFSFQPTRSQSQLQHLAFWFIEFAIEFAILRSLWKFRSQFHSGFLPPRRASSGLAMQA